MKKMVTMSKTMLAAIGTGGVDLISNTCTEHIETSKFFHSYLEIYDASQLPRACER